MKPHFLFILSLIFSSVFSQEKQLAVPSEISFRNNLAYFNGYPFTGLVIDEKTAQDIGEYKNGLKDGNFFEYYYTGKKKSENKYTNGTLNGVQTEWYVNGNKKFLSKYLSGILNGAFEEYYENGNLKSKIIYLNGKKNGEYTEWHENGQVKKSVEFHNNKLSDGKITEYDKDGKKISELKVLDGQIKEEYFHASGKQITYHDYFKGIRESEGVLINGVIKEGLWTEWYPNGKKKFQGNYANNEREGTGIEYDSEEKEIWIGEYSNGKKHGKGVLREEMTGFQGEWNKGEKHGTFTEIAENGEKSTGNYSHDKREGLWTTFYENGKKKSEVVYLRGKENFTNGKYVEWYSNGQKKEEKTYLDGYINGTHFLWHENGQVMSATKYLNGNIADGQYFTYNSSGTVAKEENYLNGIKTSEYEYAYGTRYGEFTEWYNDGRLKRRGKYTNGQRKVTNRYGEVATMDACLKWSAVMGGVVLLGILAGSSSDKK